jgi:Tfp pilus assembly protein PilN
MRTLDLDFVQPRRHFSALGLLLLTAGVVALALVMGDYLDADETLTRLESRQARQLKPSTPRVREKTPLANDDAPLLNRANDQLQRPWDAVLKTIDTAAGPGVPVLSIEAQGQARTLRLTAEAKTMGDIVALVGRLRSAPVVDTVSLTHHEERMAGAVKVIRFAVDLTWKASP